MPKGFLIKFLVLLLLLPHALQAQVLISEVLYSPTTKQWIEIYNDTDSSIDLTQYKILDGGAAVNGHSISALPGLTNILPAHSYALVAKVPDDFVSPAYPMVKSALGIKTTGDTISLKTGSTILDTLSLPDNAATGGNSYQKLNTGWSAGTPTPGRANVATSGTDAGTSTSTSSTSTSTNTTTAPYVPTFLSAHYSFVPTSDTGVSKLTTSAGRDRLGYVGMPLKFKVMSNTNDANTSYVWSFGDGGTAAGKEVEHGYLYPGEYVAVVNTSLFDNEAVSRINVKIVTPKLEIAEYTTDHILLSNKSEYEMNLYGWELRDGVKHFVFPKDTIIKSGASINLPYSITKISPEFGITLAKLSDPYISASLGLPPTTGTATTSQEIKAQITKLEEELTNLPKDIRTQIPARAREERREERSEVQAPVPTQTPAAPLVETSQTAAVTNAIKSSPITPTSTSWFSTIKRFFLGR